MSWRFVVFHLLGLCGCDSGWRKQNRLICQLSVVSAVFEITQLIGMLVLPQIGKEKTGNRKHSLLFLSAEFWPPATSSKKRFPGPGGGLWVNLPSEGKLIWTVVNCCLQLSRIWNPRELWPGNRNSSLSGGKQFWPHFVHLAENGMILKLLLLCWKLKPWQFVCSLNLYAICSLAFHEILSTWLLVKGGD